VKGTIKCNSRICR